MEGLKQIPDESVQCVVTSPPYWGLRDYGIEGQIWGGKEGCGHEWELSSHIANRSGSPGKQSTNQGAWHPEGLESKHGFCRLCGAWKGSYGLEPTPELYIQHTVEIFREVKRVLRSDGCLFLNVHIAAASSDTYILAGQ